MENITAVTDNVKQYMKVHLPKYTVLEVRKRSDHLEDAYLYMVSAKKDDGRYAVWTCWNETTKSLNFGHYGLKSEEACDKIFHEFFTKK